MEEINLKDFWNYYKKYLLIVLLVVSISIVSIFIYDKVIKTPRYSTNTTVVLAKDSNDGNETISGADVTLNQKLVSTYSEIIKSRLVLSQVISDLNLDYSVEKLQKDISVQAITNTEILKITVTNDDPNLASEIANSIAEVFNKEIIKIYKISNVSIIDRALIPEKPSNNHLVRDIALAAILSFAAASGVIFVIFYFDDTLRNVNEIEDNNVPVVAKVYKSNEKNNIDLILDQKPNSITSESIRTLRTNLQFSSVDKEVKTLLITSSVPSEGKSFVSANLAIAFAQTGKKVLLVDCDLRKGRQHRIFKVNGKEGLSSLLIGDISDSSKYIVSTNIKKLSLLPRGIVPPNPSELLNSKKNEALIQTLKAQFDIIILDGAPISGLSDSLILSSFVDKVLLVTSINHTPKTELKNTIKALENVNANLAGCIANNVDSKHEHYGAYYYGESEKDVK